MLYNHYDVQPADPLHEWTAQPFEPERRGDKLYGRGTSDNKGNITSRLLAIRALKERYGGLPCNVKFVIEGDEEIGSPQIKPFIATAPRAAASPMPASGRAATPSGTASPP